MLKSVWDQLVPKEIEMVIVNLGKIYERFPSKEELSEETGLSFKEADDYLKKYKNQLSKMR